MSLPHRSRTCSPRHKAFALARGHTDILQLMEAKYGELGEMAPVASPDEAGAGKLPSVGFFTPRKRGARPAPTLDATTRVAVVGDFTCRNVTSLVQVALPKQTGIEVNERDSLFRAFEERFLSGKTDLLDADQLKIDYLVQTMRIDGPKESFIRCEIGEVFSGLTIGSI